MHKETRSRQTVAQQEPIWLLRSQQHSYGRYLKPHLGVLWARHDLCVARDRSWGWIRPEADRSLLSAGQMQSLSIRGRYATGLPVESLIWTREAKYPCWRLANRLNCPRRGGTAVEMTRLPGGSPAARAGRDLYRCVAQSPTSKGTALARPSVCYVFAWTKSCAPAKPLSH